MSFGAIIMLGAGGASPQEKLVLEAQRAATLDLINLIQATAEAKLILSSPEFSWFPQDIDAVLEPDPPNSVFHFGEQLAALIDRHALQRVMYFGGGSAPLLDHTTMDMISGVLLSAGNTRIPSHIVLSNNRHSSDWLCISAAQDALPIIRQCQRDNSLAWALSETDQYEVRITTRLRPTTSMDLDTPTDLAIVRQHPDIAPHLESALGRPELDAVPVRKVVDVLRRDGSQVLMMGRVSPQAWEALNKVTRCWIRVFAEERGMVASERLKRGEVRSVMSELLKLKGMYGFFQTLAEMSEAAIIDNRVLIAAQHGNMLSAPDRFASDLYQVDAIQDPWLRDFTQAAAEAPIPVLLGGHNVVSGGLYAIVEIIQRL